MEDPKEEKKCALPANLPKIQITFKATGEKTTRIINDREQEVKKVNKVKNVKDVVKIVRKRPWTRKLKIDNEVTRITTGHKIFSDALLGPESTDLKIFTRFARSISNTVTLKNTPTKISPEKSEKITEKTPPKTPLLEKSPSKISTPILTPISTPISTPVKPSNSPSKPTQPPVSNLISSTLNLSVPDNISNVPTASINKSSLTTTKLSPIQVQTCKVVKELVEEVSKEVSDQTEKRKPEKVPLDAKSVAIQKGEKSPKGTKTFKVPFCPKRPPSRLQSKNITDLRDVLQNIRSVNDSLSTTDDDDDVLSLYAESIGSVAGVNISKKSSLCDFSKNVKDFSRNTKDYQKDFSINSSKDFSNNISKGFLKDFSKDSSKDSSKGSLKDSSTDYPKEFSKGFSRDCSMDFSKEVQKEKTLSPVLSNSENDKIIHTETSINPKISEWISKTKPITNQLIDFKDFPKKWCYRYLETGKCQTVHCPFKHTILAIDFNTLSEDDFQIVLKGCVEFKFLFKTFFDPLLNFMLEHERRDLILKLVLHVMSHVKVEKMPYIKKIIDALKNSGFTFTEAVNEILLTSGRNNECLLDILLAVTVEEEDCVKTSWNLISNLINFRQTHLDFGVIQDIFTKCLNDYDQKLSENIYKDIIVKNNFNLNSIDRSIVIKYVSLLQEHYQAGANYIISNYHIENEEIIKLVELNENIEQQNINVELDQEVEIGEEAVLSPVEQSPSSDQEEIDFNVLNNLQGNNNNFMFSQSGDDSGNCSQKEVKKIISPPPNPIDNQTNTNTNFYYDSFYTENQSPYIPRKRSRNANSSSSSIHTVVNTINIPELMVDEDDLTDEDIRTLVISVRSHDLGSMFSVMRKYSESEMKVKHVVLHFLAVAKEMDLETLCNLLSQMFDVFGNHWKNDYQTMNVLKTLGFNLLPRLNKGKKYKTVNDILNFFSNDYNSFVKYNHFSIDKKYNTKEMKYIFLFKSLCKCKKYKDAYNLLKSQESQLLKIFLPDNVETINQYKMSTLDKCIESVLTDDPIEAKDMIVYLMLHANVDFYPNLKLYLNLLLTIYIKHYRILKDEVINMFDVILNGWYQHLKPSVLRALLITTRPDVPPKTILKLFHICLEMEVYPDHKGRDNSISIPSNLLKEEISLLVHHHFLQICSCHFPILNIVINVTESLDIDEYSQFHMVLKGNDLTTSDMIRRVLIVLSNINNFPAADSLDVQNQYIVIPYNSAFLQPYKEATKTGIIPKIP